MCKTEMTGVETQARPEDLTRDTSARIPTWSTPEPQAFESITVTAVHDEYDRDNDDNIGLDVSMNDPK